MTINHLKTRDKTTPETRGICDLKYNAYCPTQYSYNLIISCVAKRFLLYYDFLHHIASTKFSFHILTITQIRPPSFTCTRRGTLTIVSIFCRAVTSIPPPALSPSRLRVSARGPERACSLRQDWAYCLLTSSMMVDVRASPTRIYSVHSSMYLGFSGRTEHRDVLCSG